MKTLGVTKRLSFLPLLTGLETDSRFMLRDGGMAQNALLLRGRELSASLLSPIDYARESSDYYVVPAVAVSSNKPTDTVVIHFREGIHSIRTLAVDPSDTSEIVLAKILLAEEFDAEVSIVPVVGTLETMLGRAESALLVGDAALRYESHQNQLDLIEVWNELTELPYLHAVWCGRGEGLNQEEVAAIQEAKAHGLKSLSKTAREQLATYPDYSLESLEQYLLSFSYDLTDEVTEGFREFLRYAYYHGILPDVAEINFYQSDADAPGDAVSSN